MDTDQHFEEFLEDTYQESVEMAQAALDRGDDQLALELAEECLEDRHLDVEVLNICAVAATNLDDLVKAEGLFLKALQLDPRNGALHHNYAVLLDRKRHFEKAVRHLEKALELQPDFPEAYINLGNVLDELNRTEEALECYREALRRMPDSHDAYYNIGYACNRLGRFEEAVDNFKRALEFDDEDAGSQNGAGFALFNLGQVEEAAGFYDRAIALEAENATYRFNRGLLRSHTGDLEGALEDYTQAVRADSDFFEAVLEMLATLIELDRFVEAEALLNHADTLDPDSPEPPFFRALLAERQGDPLAALVHIEESLRRDPESLQVLNNKGNILLGLGRLADALACFDQLLARDPGYALAHFNRACVLAQKGEGDAALAALAAALEQDASLWQELLDDPDFEPIRRHPRFDELVIRYRPTSG